jgi:hypothetical protein
MSMATEGLSMILLQQFTAKLWKVRLVYRNGQIEPVLSLMWVIGTLDMPLTGINHVFTTALLWHSLWLWPVKKDGEKRQFIRQVAQEL